MEKDTRPLYNWTAHIYGGEKLIYEKMQIVARDIQGALEVAEKAIDDDQKILKIEMFSDLAKTLDLQS